MKKKLRIVFVLFSVICLSSSIFANDKEMKSLELSLDNYFTALKNNDVKGMVDSIYEPAFKLTPKKDLVAAMETAYESNKTPKLINAKKIKILPIEKYEKGLFTRAYYKILMRMDSPSKKEEEIKQFESILKTMLADKKPKITYNKEENVFNIDMESFILAINENNIEWKFLADNFIDNLVAAKLIPLDILASIKEK